MAEWGQRPGSRTAAFLLFVAIDYKRLPRTKWQIIAEYAFVDPPIYAIQVNMAQIMLKVGTD